MGPARSELPCLFPFSTLFHFHADGRLTLASLFLAVCSCDGRDPSFSMGAGRAASSRPEASVKGVVSLAQAKMLPAESPPSFFFMV